MKKARVSKRTTDVAWRKDTVELIGILPLVLIPQAPRPCPDDEIIKTLPVGPLAGKPWPLLATTVDYVAEHLKIHPAAACLELQDALRMGQVKALDYDSGKPIDQGIWRYAVPHVDGTVSGLGVFLTYVRVCAEDVFAVWPPGAAGLAAPVTSSTESDTPSVRPASVDQVREAIGACYKLAAEGRTKPPNLKEIGPPVQEALRVQGYEAAQRWIQELAESPEFAKCRLKPGHKFEQNQ